MDAQIQAWSDHENARTAEVVRNHGWLIQYVGGDARRRLLQTRL